ncbi:hypothetical protein ABTY59_26835 [Streptomyces sp. NPDC096079]
MPDLLDLLDPLHEARPCSTTPDKPDRARAAQLSPRAEGPPT